MKKKKKFTALYHVKMKKIKQKETVQMMQAEQFDLFLG